MTDPSPGQVNRKAGHNPCQKERETMRQVNHYHDRSILGAVRRANKIARVVKRIDRYSPVYEDGVPAKGAKLNRVLNRNIVRVLKDVQF